MAGSDPRIAGFFAGATRWRAELLALRAILQVSPLTEEFKWRSPCYTFEGGNVATIWGMKECCGLSFFKGVLLKDPAGLLVAPGAHSRSVRLARFTAVDQIHRLKATLAGYILEAVEVERAGLKVEFPKDDLEVPVELLERLGSDPAFKSAFEALTPGRRRGWLLHFSQPKQARTRAARIEKAAPRILAGKGMHDR